jgi:outer membrane protein assembly factor BamB
MRCAWVVFLCGCSTMELQMPMPMGVPELGALTVVGTSADGLMAPRDLQFAPEHPDQLWTVNQASHGAVIFFDPGTPKQRAEVRIDAYGQHFMASVSSLAFGTANRFATCQESRDEWNEGPQPPDDFMGPTLWTADLAIFAKHGQAFPKPVGGSEGSHLDMLHESPLCMGIAHDVDNVYWAFDGNAGNIVRYDFAMDHGPGGGNHSDGRVRRFSDVTVTRVSGVASHMVLDAGMLYIADTGAKRIVRLDTKTGDAPVTVTGRHEPLAEHTAVKNAVKEVLIADAGQRPSGIAIGNGKLFVSDSATGVITAYGLDGKVLGSLETKAQAIMGLTLGPDGKVWFVDRDASTLVRIDPR